MILFGNWACHGVPVFKQKTQIITLGLSQKLESPNPIICPVYRYLRYPQSLKAIYGECPIGIDDLPGFT